MAKKEYIHTGECIWCKRKKPFVSFFKIPHIVPRALGSNDTGVDVCDDCNFYFGTCTQQNKTISHDLAFKEVFNACINSLGERPKVAEPYSSALFNYNRIEDKIRLKRSFSLDHFTRQFKRSLYEVFLQKYHATFPDENLDKFEDVRKFARYNIGSPLVLFATNKMILHFTERKYDIMVNMSDQAVDFINRTGFYHLFFCGKHLFLQVLPITSQINWKESFKEIFETGVIPCDEDCRTKELTNIWEFDMFYTSLAPKLLVSSGKYLY